MAKGNKSGGGGGKSGKGKDKEASTIRKVTGLIEELGGASKTRVVKYLLDRYADGIGAVTHAAPAPGGGEAGGESAEEMEETAQ